MKSIKFFVKILLVLCLCLPMACQTVFADNGEGNLEPLPQTWSNNTKIKNLNGGWLYFKSFGFKLDVEYYAEVRGEDNGTVVSPDHIKNQWLKYNGKEIYFVKDFEKVKDLSTYTINEWGITDDEAGKQGILYTTWDNGRTEEDVFIPYTGLFVQYLDINTKKSIHDYVSASIYTFNNGKGEYNLSDKDAIDIDGYRYLKTDNQDFLKGTAENITGETNINVWYVKQMTVTYKDGNDGNTFKDQTYTVDENSKTPAFDGTPEREGFAFVGWDKEIADTVTGDVIYTAQWKVDDTEENTKIDQTEKDDEEDNVETGDSNDLAIYIGIGMMAMATLGAAFVLKKRVL